MDDEKLISKKDVLEEMGISYGQLYRWKRKGLIPEGWFVRRSTFTGQETFFPRDKIIERIRQIKEMKEQHPLDDLAEVITERVDAEFQVALDRLKSLNWFDDSILKTCRIERLTEKPLSIADTLCVAVLSRIRGSARPEELDLVQRTLREKLAGGLLDRLGDEPLHLYVCRKAVSSGEISAEISLVVIAREKTLFDADIRLVGTVDLRSTLERIKLDLAKESPASNKNEPESETEVQS